MIRHKLRDWHKLRIAEVYHCPVDGNPTVFLSNRVLNQIIMERPLKKRRAWAESYEIKQRLLGRRL